jgi:hypothetical protein
MNANERELGWNLKDVALPEDLVMQPIEEQVSRLSILRGPIADSRVTHSPETQDP